MVELEGGIRRQTFALPLGIDHVHCYLLPSSDGGWTAVDTGLGLPDAGSAGRGRWTAWTRRCERIAITHFHPDHVGAAADLAELTGAPVFQGVDDYDQCIRTWGELRVEGRMPDYLRVHGTPEEDVESFEEEGRAFVQFVRFVRDPERLEPGGRAGRLGGAPPARTRRRPSRAAARRDPGRRRHLARIDHARTSACIRTPGPIRSPTTSRRWSASPSSPRGLRCRVTASRSRIPPAGRAS